MKTKRIYQILTAFIVIFATQSVFAAVDISVERYLLEMNISDVVKAEMDNSQFDTSKVIPLTLQPTENQDSVTRQIMGHWIDNTLNSKAFRDSYIGKKTTHVRDSLNPKIQLSSENSKSTIKFQILTSEQRAVLTYNGVVDANVSYQIGAETALLQVSKKISNHTKLTYSLLNNTEETKNTLALSHQF